MLFRSEAAFRQPKSRLSFEAAVEQTESLFVKAFNDRMVADVPVGVFLSGGYDSSCVTALLQKNSSTKIKTFTIGFREDDFNESVHARKVADYLGTDHHEYICTYREAMDIVPDLPSIYDEPFGDSSAIPTTLVSRFARKHVTVALSADAGDELFAGYPRHAKNIRYLRRLDLLPSGVPRLLSNFIPENGKDISTADRFGKLKQVLAATDTASRFKVINQVYTLHETKLLLNPKSHPQSLSTRPNATYHHLFHLSLPMNPIFPKFPGKQKNKIGRAHV